MERDPITMIFARTIRQAEHWALELDLKPHSRSVMLVSPGSLRNLNGFMFRAGDHIVGLYAMEWRVQETIRRMLIRLGLRMDLDGKLVAL